jgi:hypothetical protein
MRRLLPIVLFTLIPLTGCSSPEPELSYDPVELIEYENCLTSKREKYKDYPSSQENWTLRDCVEKKPVLK